MTQRTGQKSSTSRTGSALSRYLADIRGFRLLSKEEEIKIGKRISKGRRESQNDLVVSNLGFVVKIASEYQNMGLPFEDLLNEGNMGLIHAASRYDHTKSIKFITYASWWVRKSILKALSDQSSMIRVPSYQRKKLARQRAEAEAASSHRHTAADPPCDECSAPTSTIARYRAVSLDEPPAGEGHSRLIEMMVDRASVDPEEQVIKKENLSRLKGSLSNLNDKERVVIVRRFGLLGGRISTLKEIGASLGLSRERVRQIEMSARKKLRSHLHRSSLGLDAKHTGRRRLRKSSA